MSKQLQKFSNVLEKLFAPLAAKLAGNLYLQVIATSFMTILPLILIGSFALILSQPIVDYHLLSKTDVFYPVMKGWAQAAEVYGSHLNFLFGVTLGSQGVYLSLAIAYNLAQKRQMNVFLTMLVALVSFLVVNSQYVEWNWDTAYFGGTGLFSAIITTFAAVELYHLLVRKRVGYIAFPDTVPASLKESIGALVPLALVFLTMVLIRMIFAEVFATSVPKLLMMIGQPLNLAVDTVFGVSLASVVSQLGWWFGIHSSAILSVVMPSFDANTLRKRGRLCSGNTINGAASDRDEFVLFQFCSHRWWRCDIGIGAVDAAKQIYSDSYGGQAGDHSRNLWDQRAGVVWIADRFEPDFLDPVSIDPSGEYFLVLRSDGGRLGQSYADQCQFHSAGGRGAMVIQP